MNHIAKLGLVFSLVAGCGAPRSPNDEGGPGVSAAALSQDGSNVALASRGATVTASSQARGFPATTLIDGDLRNGTWRDGTPGLYPDSVTVTFGGLELIDEIAVHALAAPGHDGGGILLPPTGPATTARSFTVQYFNGVTWLQLAAVSGNSEVVRRFTFAPVMTTKIRVTVTLGSPAGDTELVAIEAWTVKSCAATCTASSSCSAANRCLGDTGMLTTCNQYGPCDRGECVQQCTSYVPACDQTCTAGGGLATTCGEMTFTCIPPPPRCSQYCSRARACDDACRLDDGTDATCEEVACSAPRLRGLVSHVYGADVNRCLASPAWQVANLGFERASRLYFYPQSFPRTGTDFELSGSWPGDHWQSVARLPGMPSRLLLTLNQEANNDNTGFIGLLDERLDEPAGWAVLMLANDPWPRDWRYNHPGGAQALGLGYVAVAEENRDRNLTARVQFFDQQLLVSQSGTVANGPGSLSTFLVDTGDDLTGAASVAITKLAPLQGESASRYLMLVSNGPQVLYWISNAGASLANPNVGWQKSNWMTMRLPNGTFLNSWGSPQNMNLVTECDTGELYVLSWMSEATNQVRLHKVNLNYNFAEQRLQAGSGAFAEGNIGLTHAATAAVQCGDSDDWCNFRMGAGSYVLPDGRLEILGTSRGDDPVRTARFVSPLPP